MPWPDLELPLLDASCPLPLDQPFTVSGADRLGVSRSQLRLLVKRGLVRRVVQGVYAAAQAPNDLAFRAAALSLVVSPSAVVTDRAAAWLHGVDLLPRSARSKLPAVSVYQRPGTRSRRPGVDSGERMLLARDIVEVNGLAVTSPLRTALDLGRLLWRFDALAALDQFLRLGVTQDEMLLELDRFKGYRGVIQLRVFVSIADARAESVAESALRLHWYDAGLPRPELQWWVCENGVNVWRLDLALPELRFSAEYDGVEYHSTDAARAHDEGRRSWLADRNWLVEVFCNHDVYAPTADPGPRLRRGLAQARAALSLPTSYPTLETRSAGSPVWARPNLTGQRFTSDQK